MRHTSQLVKSTWRSNASLLHVTSVLIDYTTVLIEYTYVHNSLSCLFFCCFIWYSAYIKKEFKSLFNTSHIYCKIRKLSRSDENFKIKFVSPFLLHIKWKYIISLQWNMRKVLAYIAFQFFINTLKAHINFIKSIYWF